jgi:NTP pyrophosphatase (non-canonical NTP hydrolase)
MYYNDSNMTEHIENIKQWGRERGLINKEAAPKQLLKTMEELGETAGALLKGNRAGLKDGIGDVLVTLVLFAEIEGLSLDECLQAAWQEIKDRKGNTINGVFVKEEKTCQQ